MNVSIEICESTEIILFYNSQLIYNIFSVVKWMIFQTVGHVK